jgi:hypothetical protein
MNRVGETKNTVERPIAKPNNPLPLAFSPSRRSEMNTKRRGEGPTTNERAYFYRKGSNGSSPVYDFVITTEGGDTQSRTNN